LGSKQVKSAEQTWCQYQENYQRYDAAGENEL